MRKDSAIVQYIKFIAIMALVLAAGSLGGLNLLLPFVVPSLIAVYSYQNRLMHGVVYVLMSASIAILLPGGLWLVLLFVYGAIGIALGRYLKRRRPVEETVFGALLAALFGLLLLLIAVQILSGGSLLELLQQTIDEVALPAELIDSFAQISGAASDFDRLQLEQTFKQMMLTVMPSVFALALFIQVVISYLLSAVTLRKLGHNLLAAKKFSNIKLPGNPIGGTLIVVILALLAAWLLPDYGNAITVNTMYVVLLLFAVQGLAVLAHTVKYIKLNVILKIVIFAVTLAFIQLHGLAIVGWLEASFKIRNRLKRRALK